MLRLVIVSLIWAFSFGLLKHRLSGIHPDLVNAIRMLFALAIFVPWLFRRSPGVIRTLELSAIGAVQFGLMYAVYNRSFAHLEGHQVALATILTPLYVTLFDDLLQRQLRWRYLLSAILSVGGTALSIGVGQLQGALVGFLLIQAANLCFAVGQVWYRRAQARGGAPSDAAAMAWAYFGGAVVVTLAALPRLSLLDQIQPPQWLALSWLGPIASALCFFLWNSGARLVNTGVLAVINDLKIPLGVSISLLVFGESANVLRLLAGASIIFFAWWLAASGSSSTAPLPSAATRAAAASERR